jgi:hypothetical protein
LARFWSRRFRSSVMAAAVVLNFIFVSPVG